MGGKDDTPACEDALEFEPEEFALLYDLVAQASAEMAARSRNITGARGGDSPEDARRARSAALSRALSRVRERYEGDPARYHSAVHRLRALAAMIKNPRLSEYVRSTREGVSVHRSVIRSAAVVRLTTGCEFPPDEFLCEVRRLAECD